MPHRENEPDIRCYALRVFMDMELHVSAILGDFVCNLRSSLDHLVCAVVTKHGGKITNQTAFPIVTRDIWSSPNHVNERKRFDKCIAGMPDDAKAAVKRLQPGITNTPATRALAILQKLSNEDKHRNLVPFMIGLRDALVIATVFGEPAGGWRHDVCQKDAIIARLSLPPGTPHRPPGVDVQVRGTPEIAVDVGAPEGHLEIRKVAVELMRRIPVEVFPELEHFAL